MKSLFLFILITFITGSSFCQTGWFIQPGGINVVLNSMYFVNSNTGWICGDSGKIIKTTDGGVNWIQQSSSTQYPLVSVFFINGNTGWCAGGTSDFNFFINRMLVLKTIDGGDTWIQSFYTNSSYTRFGPIYFTDEMNGSVLLQGGTGSGTIGGMYSTSDGGFTWLPVLSSGYANMDLQFTDLNTGWYLGRYLDDTGHDTASIGRSTDAGNTWNTNYQRTNTNFKSLYFLDNNTGWITGFENENSVSNSFVLKTSNSGVSWEKYDFALEVIFNHIFFTDPQNGWGCSGRIYRTMNGGLNWNLQLDFSGNFFNTIFFTDSLTGWVAGENGLILKTVTGGITSLNSSNEILPGEFILKQNYPNPFNPRSIINYKLVSTNYISIKIYDILGNQVSVLINEKKNAGSYEIEFDGSSFASGIYFYSLYADGKLIDTKRMMLLK